MGFGGKVYEAAAARKERQLTGSIGRRKTKQDMDFSPKAPQDKRKF
jgi:hypothetical protein